MLGLTKKPQVDMEIFTIYDSKTSSYGNPVHAPNHFDLQRQLINMFKDPSQSQNTLMTNSEDFSIFRIGTYDKKTGRIEATNLEHIVNLHDLKALAKGTEDVTQRN